MINKISGKIQNYAWGGHRYIPQLLGQENSTDKPAAEYWLGSHQKAPSQLSINGNQTTLDRIIQQEPQFYLGKETAEKFGRLPYLFKVLDVHDMLSIQVHPSKKEAEIGFAKENEEKIPLDAPYRNYKDDNHKPEMMVALSDFYLLHGFKSEDKLIQQLQRIKEFSALLPIFGNQGYKVLYKEVMTMPQEKVNRILRPLLEHIIPLYKANQLSKTDPAFWASRAVDSGMATLKNIDRGIFSIYFFNLLHLKTGEGIFQAAGLPHAYLEGQNIELMANSDNVLRGGLTQKHVDVAELLKHTQFEGIMPQIISADQAQSRIQYPCDIPDFNLEQIRLKKEETVLINTFSTEISLLLKGEVLFYTPKKEILAKKGEAVLLTAGEEVQLKATEDAIIFKAGVPKS